MKLSPAQLFFAHTGTYFAFLLFGLIADELFSLPPISSLNGATLFSAFLATLSFYPPIAIAHVFHRQYNKPSWRLALGGYTLLAVAFGGICVHGAMNGQFVGFGILFYILFGISVGSIIAIVTSIIGCIKNTQNGISKTIGYATLVLMVTAMVTGILTLTSPLTSIMATSTITFGSGTAALALIGVLVSSVNATRKTA